MPNPVGLYADKSEVRPWQGILNARRLALVVAFALVIVMSYGGTASALESTWPTAQAKAYNFDFVPYLDPPAKPAAICLVDSGVDITPDTPPDSPDGPILERTALDGGPGTGVDSDHGTYMAMAAGAPMNDWGTVGLWPGVRIVSVRAMPQGQDSFPFDDYARAIVECQHRSAADNISVVNLSLGCACVYASGTLTDLQDQVVRSHKYGLGLNVVASAGNVAGAIGMPAAADGVFSVGAGTSEGRLCSYSNRGSDLDLVAPGCDLDGAWPGTGQPFVDWIGGTSPASGMAAAALALLRSYRPDLDWREAEQLAARSARHTPEGNVLDIASLLQSAGLDALVDAARARAAMAHSNAQATPITVASPSSPAPDLPGDPRASWAGDTSQRDRLVTPRLARMFRRKGGLHVLVVNRPRHARLCVEVQRRLGEFRYSTRVIRKRSRDGLVIPLPQDLGAGRISIQYEIAGRPDRTSPTIYRPILR